MEVRQLKVSGVDLTERAGPADEVIPDVIDGLRIRTEPAARGVRNIDGTAVGEQGQTSG